MEKKKKTQPNTIDKINAELGKIPPQAIDIEEAVLGALMIEKDAINIVADTLKEEVFYKDSHKLIYKAIRELSLTSEPIDLLTVTNKLKKQKSLEEAGGRVYLLNLTNKIASSSHLEYHSKILIQKYIERRLIEISSEIQQQAYFGDKDVEELLNYSEAEIFKIAEGTVKTQAEPVKTILAEAINQIQEASKQRDGLSGVPSGFRNLDEVTSGWQKSDLIIVAARPAMGKTAFVLNMARNMAVDFNEPVAFFSLEMSKEQLVKRLIVTETKIDSKKIKTGKLDTKDWKVLDDNMHKLEEAPIYIDDTPAISIFELRAKCRRLKAQYKIKMIIIDYLQLMTGDMAFKGNREQQISGISRSLKSLAKELDLPIITLSQLSRAVETRGGGKRPQLSDLRESGAIEQDADIVIFIYRPEYYQLEENSTETSFPGLSNIIIAKHRNGEVRDVELKFTPQYAEFTEPTGESLDDGYFMNSKINSDNNMPDNNFDKIKNTDFTSQSFESEF